MFNFNNIFWILVVHYVRIHTNAKMSNIYQNIYTEIDVHYSYYEMTAVNAGQILTSE